MPGSADALDGPVLEVAPRLLGAVLRHGEVAVRVTEVEAYDGPDDPGSHSFNGRTDRNAVMFGPPGRLYVYFTYGMHHCCNVVVGPEGVPSAVLLRAGEVVEGRELARERRRSADRDLARGPARLCQALGIDLTHNGTDLSAGTLTLDLGPARNDQARKDPARKDPARNDPARNDPARNDPAGNGPAGNGPAYAGPIRTGPRVGLRKAADRPWRFWIDGDPTVSTYRPASVRRRTPG